MEIISKKVKENPLMQRTEVEVVFRITGGMPSRTQFKEEIVKNFNWEKENVIIKKISTKFGNYDVKVNAFLYSNKEALKKYESLVKKKDKTAREKEVKEKEEGNNDKGEEVKKEENNEKSGEDDVSNEIKEENKQEKAEEKQE